MLVPEVEVLRVVMRYRAPEEIASIGMASHANIIDTALSVLQCSDKCFFFRPNPIVFVLSAQDQTY